MAPTSRQEQFALAIASLIGAALIQDELCQRAAYKQMKAIYNDVPMSFWLVCAMSTVAYAGLADGDKVVLGLNGSMPDRKKGEEALMTAGALIAAVANGDYTGALALYRTLDVYEAAQAYGVIFVTAVAVMVTALISRWRHDGPR